MSQDEPLDIALAAARRAGADAADAVLAERTAVDVIWRLGGLEKLERKDAREIGLRVLVGRRVATASTNRMDAASIEAMAEDAVAAARLLPEDPWAGLARASQLASGWPDLDLADPDEPSVEALLRAAAAAEDAARAVPGVTNSDGGSAFWSRLRFTLAATNGFHGSYVRTRHGVGATVLAGTGTGMQGDGEFRTATHRADLPTPEVIGRLAGERTVRSVGPRKVATAQVPVVYEPRLAASLLRHFAGAIGGEAVAAGRSFLKGCLGQAVFAPGVTITDDPLRRRGLESIPFDDEGIGVATRRLIDDGVLTTWLLDLASARRLGLASTGHASRSGAVLGSPRPTNLTLAAGRHSPEELLADIASGFYVTDMMGTGVCAITGDYSRGASGFWIENGKLAYPVSDVTVAGNLVAMFRNLVPATDLEITGAIDSPTVRIDGLTVAGT
jgi:PmbA protein